MIFDRDAEKILNKSVRDLVEKKINIGEEIPYDLKKIFGKKKKHFPTSFKWIQSKGWFWKFHSC